MEDILVNMNRKESKACVDAVITIYNQKNYDISSSRIITKSNVITTKNSNSR